MFHGAPLEHAMLLDTSSSMPVVSFCAASTLATRLEPPECSGQLLVLHRLLEDSAAAQDKRNDRTGPSADGLDDRRTSHDPTAAGEL